MAEPSRIKDIPEGEMTAEQTKVFEHLVGGRGKVTTPYKMWIHAPQLAAALATVGNYLNTASSMRPREMELIKCIIGDHWKGEYLWTAHARKGVMLGIPQSVFDAIRAGQTPQLDDERERAIYDLTKIAMEPGGGPDEVFNRAEKLLGRNGIAEVLSLMGYYSAVAMGLKVHRVAAPA